MLVVFTGGTFLFYISSLHPLALTGALMKLVAAHRQTAFHFFCADPVLTCHV